MKDEDPDPRSEQRRRAYSARINRVLDYIQENLEEEFRLDSLARIAGFSPFHFHRIFKSMTGEALFQFIQRLRLEKAASQLLMNPQKQVTDIAFDCGFSGSAPFARAFRESFGMSASQWRRSKYSKQGKISGKIDKTPGNERQDCRVSLHYNDGNQIYWRLTMNQGKTKVQAEVKELPAMPVAYLRHTGPYMNDAELFRSLFTRLISWAAPRGLLNFPESKLMSVYHDDPAVTEENKHRVSCCLSVPPQTEVSGEVGLMTIPAGKYALARFELAVGEYEAAWNAVFRDWLPQSGWQCDDRPCFELYHNNCDEHPEKKSILDICIPVKAL